MMKEKTRDILEWILCIIIAIVLALLIKYYLVSPTVVKQISMSPTLENNDRILLNRWMRTTKQEVKRGDIITFEAPSKTANLEDNSNDEEYLIALYNKEFNNWFEKFLYYVLEITKESYIKRVIALPGEHLTISEDGDVYINGEKLEESYLEEGLKTKRSGEYYDLVVPENCVFVMGDNREYSNDSRIFGCIPIDKIEGKVICRFWPLNKIGKVN